MKLREILMRIDAMIAYHCTYMYSESKDYHKGALDALVKLQDEIMQKGGEE